MTDEEWAKCIIIHLTGRPDDPTPAEAVMDQDDLRVQFNGMIAGLGRLSALAYINDLKREADNTDRRECGNCTLWMCRGDCPRERGTMVGGPSTSSPACDKFNLKPWVAELKEKRMNEVKSRLAALS